MHYIDFFDTYFADYEKNFKKYSGAKKICWYRAQANVSLKKIDKKKLTKNIFIKFFNEISSLHINFFPHQLQLKCYNTCK